MTSLARLLIKNLFKIGSLGTSEITELFVNAEILWRRTAGDGSSAIGPHIFVEALMSNPDTHIERAFISAASRLNVSFRCVPVGEDLWRTLEVASRYANLLVVRHPYLDSVDRASQLRCPIISAGGGKESPLRALTDLYVLARSWEGGLEAIASKTFVFTGNVWRNEEVRSFLTLLALYRPKQVAIVPLPGYPDSSEIVSLLAHPPTALVMGNDLSPELLAEADVVFFAGRPMSPEPDRRFDRFQINNQNLAPLRTGTVVMGDDCRIFMGMAGDRPEFDYDVLRFEQRFVSIMMAVIEGSLRQY